MITTSPLSYSNSSLFFFLLVKNLFVLFKQHLFCQNVLTDFSLIDFFFFLKHEHDMQTFSYFQVFPFSSSPFSFKVGTRPKQQLCLCRPAPDRKQQPAPGPPRGKWSRNTSRTLYHNSAWCISLNKAASHILSQNLSSFSLEKLAKAAFLLKGLPASPRISIRASFLHRDCRYQASRTFP